MDQRLLADAQPQPWRNGGGVTRELLAWPAAPAWQLRVSVAQVDAGGAFSRFDGVERWFAVLHGAGVALTFAARQVVLDAASDALCFDGADAPGCTLNDGPTQDLNFMLTRAAGSGLLQRAAVGADWVTDAPWRGLFCAGSAAFSVDGVANTLSSAGVAFDTAAAHQRWRLTSASAAAWWLQWRPAR